MLALIVSAHVVAHQCGHAHKHRPAVPCVAHASAASMRVERAARHRYARLIRLTLLERRAAILEDLVLRAETHAPVFAAAPVDAGHGIDVRDVHVDREFSGSLVLRARVVNRGPALTMGLLEADLVDPAGNVGRASVAIDRLAAGEERAVEALCPTSMTPVRVDLKATRF